MARCDYIPVDILRQTLKYDPKTGKLFWRERPAYMFPDSGSGGAAGCAKRWNARCAGKEALSHKTRGGYLAGPVLGQVRISHQVAWAVYYGAWPKNPIDHINGIRDDNRIGNLRSVSYSENAKNQRLPKNNKSGAMGVRLYKPTGKWLAVIGVGGKRIHLGYFDTKGSAIAARKQAEEDYGYHVNHGRNP